MKINPFVSTLEAATHRGAKLIPLRETLQGYPGLSQTRSTALVRRKALTDRLPHGGPWAVALAIQTDYYSGL